MRTEGFILLKAVSKFDSGSAPVPVRLNVNLLCTLELGICFHELLRRRHLLS